MDYKEKAEELVSKFSSQLPWYSEEDNTMKAKILARFAVDQIIDALEKYDELTEGYLKEQFGVEFFSSELQNMDNDFRYWSKVKNELL